MGSDLRNDNGVSNAAVSMGVDDLSLLRWTCHGLWRHAEGMNNEWAVIGELVRRRRERLGLKQDELKPRGGPGSATVGKVERAVQDGFPLRTQHQLERALGWEHGLIEEVMLDVVEKGSTADDWADETVGANVPDMSEDVGPTELEDLQARLRAVELRLAELEVATIGLVLPDTAADDTMARLRRRNVQPVADAARDIGKSSRGQAKRLAADQAGEPLADDPEDMEPR